MNDFFRMIFPVLSDMNEKWSFGESGQIKFILINTIERIDLFFNEVFTSDISDGNGKRSRFSIKRNINLSIGWIRMNS